MDNFIFDLDGTLLNTLNDLAASTNYALRWAGMPEHTAHCCPLLATLPQVATMPCAQTACPSAPLTR